MLQTQPTNECSDYVLPIFPLTAARSKLLRAYFRLRWLHVSHGASNFAYRGRIVLFEEKKYRVANVIASTSTFVAGAANTPSHKCIEFLPNGLKRCDLTVCQYCTALFAASKHGQSHTQVWLHAYVIIGLCSWI